MKKMFALGALSALCFVSSLSAFACEDGQLMADDAALAVARRTLAGCKVASSSLDSASSRLEVWTVNVRCSGFMGAQVYEVKLKELEDAVCTIKSVRLVESQE